MSEYWVAHKKYFCKYCNIYIADDAPSRRQHETGLRHKGNVERFVRGLYKAGEKRKHDLEEEKRDMARVEKAAEAAYAQDVSAGLVKPGSSSAVAGPSSAAAASKPAASMKPSNPFANYTTAESLGYTDPDEERRLAEAALRQKEGVAGEWQFVEVVEPRPAAEESGAPGGDHAKQEPGAEGSRAGEKRPAEEPVDEEDARGWKLRRKKINVGLGELYDPGALPIKLKAKKEEPEEGGLSQAGGFSTVVGGSLPPLGGTEMPSWSARGWNKPGAAPRSTASPEPTASSNGQDKQPGDGETQTGIKHVPRERATPKDVLPESSSQQPQSDLDTSLPLKTEVDQLPVKPEPADVEAPPPGPSGGSMFKKRKAPAGGGRGGRRIEGR
ncbi:hypothetical protein TRAPUB_2168 [Trametes pubescens]|uniref:Matrin-type domain-containing protein n=1 Tax=Trametes pubescens TaxID=154538 RepID=A0A1M2VH95_TRAPU|nr:hypothetical protein TRAPUB_2168 [Trametes pubescens]